LYLLKRYAEAKASRLGLLSELALGNNGLRFAIGRNLSMTYGPRPMRDSAIFWTNEAISAADQLGKLRARQSARQHPTSKTNLRANLAELPEGYTLAQALDKPYKIAELDLLTAQLYLDLNETATAKPYLFKALL